MSRLRLRKRRTSAAPPTVSRISSNVPNYFSTSLRIPSIAAMAAKGA